MAGPDFPAFASLRAFEAIGRLGGVRRAAAALGLDHAVVSRHLRGLEQQLGAALYDRAAARLTPAGLAYHTRIAAALAEIAAATAMLGPDRSHLRIWCSPGIAAPWLTARLPGFTAQRGQLLDFRTTDRAPDFERDEADSDVRYQAGEATDPVRGVRAVTLARPAIFPLVAPVLASALAGKVRTPGDVVGLPLIQEGDVADWPLWLTAHGVGQAPGAGVARYGNAYLALAAARAGQGVALGNHYLVADDLAAGRLVPLCAADGTPLGGAAIGSYVFRSDERRWHSPAVAGFRRWLVEQFRRDPAPGDPCDQPPVQAGAAPAR